MDLMKQLLFLLIMFFAHSFAINAQVVTSPNRNPAVRTVPDSVVEKMQKDKDYAYANDMLYWKKTPPRQRSSFDKLMLAIARSAAIKVILYSLLIAGILYALYQVMVVNNFFIFSGARRKKKTGEESDDTITNENLDDKIKDAISNKNYRHAIRYMYLKTLKLLSDNNIITLNAKSTNQDYIRQMYKHNNLAQFRHLTRIYEYVWYGEFDPSEAQFEIITTNFNRFNHRT
jgi:hypothetical protein